MDRPNIGALLFEFQLIGIAKERKKERTHTQFGKYNISLLLACTLSLSVYMYVQHCPPFIAYPITIVSNRVREWNASFYKQK